MRSARRTSNPRSRPPTKAHPSGPRAVSCACASSTKELSWPRRFSAALRDEFRQPRQCRTMPALALRRQVCALTHGANADAVVLRTVADGGCVEMRAAFAAKGLGALIAAFCDLDVDAGHAADDPESAAGRERRDAKGGAGQRLAIRTMADTDRF